MGFLSMFLTFVGYMLVYAATANHGRFASAPWLGVMAEAYDIPSNPGPGVPYIPGTKIGPGATPPAPTIPRTQTT